MRPEARPPRYVESTDRFIARRWASFVVEFEAFLTGKLIGLPALSRTVSHLTMKRIKG